MRLFYSLAAFVAAMTSTVSLADSLGGAFAEISVRVSLEVTSRMTTEATLCSSTKQSSPDQLPPSCHFYFHSVLDPVDAAELQREAYAFDGPMLRHVAKDLGVNPKQLALAIVRRAPSAPTHDQLRHLLAYAAKAFEPSPT